ncbi:hypothetical protein LCGC14_1267360, partial [marine sediment metagenome]
MPGPGSPNLGNISGICGPSGRSCKLIWHSQYPNKVGTYPEDLLPSRRTIWHATDDGGYSFPPPITRRGDTFGLGVLGFFTGSGLFGSDIEFDIFDPQQHVTIIFARTANRINVPHILTQDEIDSIDDDNIATINVGEYIFEAVAATEAVAIINNQLTAEEIEQVESSGDKESDRAFRKLFTLDVLENRYSNIKRNELGVEYRLDNGGPKTNAMFDLPSAGDLYNANYRDGSSRELLINLNPAFPTPPEEGASRSGEARPFRAGDVIYLTYVAIKEHYIRQMVKISHSFFAISLPPDCMWLGSTIKAANFRFFEWQIKPDDNRDLPVTLGGWRAVDAVNVPLNVNALVIPIANPELATFTSVPQIGLIDYRYMPANDPDPAGEFLRVSQLQQFVDNKSLLFITPVNSIRGELNEKYPNPINDDYKLSAWYVNRVPTTFANYHNLIRHTYFNVHPKAMDKRDVDKVAFERSLADALIADAKAGKQTNVPFQDDPRIDNPFTTFFDTLSSANLRFDPIQPPSSNFGADVECGVAGSLLLSLSNAAGDVIAFFHVESPFITEPFDKDTRVLVERHFTVGGSGPQLVSVEGAPAAINALTTIADPSGRYGFTIHTNDEGFMVINKYFMAYVKDAMYILDYRPDILPPVDGNNDPRSIQFDNMVGYTGTLGDEPGFHPGLMLSVSAYMPLKGNNFGLRYKSSKTNLELTGVGAGQIDKLTIERNEDKLIITPESGGVATYHRTLVEYTYPGEEFDTMLLFKSGNNIMGVVDSISVRKSSFGATLKITHPWMQGNILELVGLPEEFEVQSVTLTSIDESLVNDFLKDFDVSSSASDKTKDFMEKLSDKSVFFESTVMTLAEDQFSRMFCFFEDADGGISALQSDDFSLSWYFHYGIVEEIGGRLARAPFAIQNFITNHTYLFFLFSNKLMCKKIDYADFMFEDALMVERVEKDLLERAEEAGEVTTEKTGVMSF